MLLYLVKTVDAFLPLALCLGLFGALLHKRTLQERSAPQFWSVLIGVVAGGSYYGLADASEQFTAGLTALSALLLATALPAVVLLLLVPLHRSMLGRFAWAAAGLFWTLLSAQGVFVLCNRVYYEGLSVTSVLNTELLLNLGGIFSGLMVLVALCFLVFKLTLKGGIRTGALVLAGAIAVLGSLWCAEALLGLMRLQLLELTSARLSFVAVVTDFGSRRSYLLLGLILLLAIFYLLRERSVCTVTASPDHRAQRRKEVSLRLAAHRRFKHATALIVMLVGGFLYQDLYASRPPSISEPEVVRPGSDGLLRFNITDVADGRLHRFAYVMQDGKVIRFFLMNRFSDQIKIGVSYDACLLCGDMGYIQEEDNLICLACSVSIFVPSLGKEGGCNPIPLPHRVAGNEILIAAADLEAGGVFFREVKDIEVLDPVTGERLINTEAPFQYEHLGKTYFFASETSWKSFRRSPQEYVKTGEGECDHSGPCPDEKPGSHGAGHGAHKTQAGKGGD